MTHIYVSKLTIIGSDNGLSPGRRQAIIWTIAGILSIGPLGTNFNEISKGIQTFSFKKMHFKMSSVKWRPFCLGLNGLKTLWLLMSKGYTCNCPVSLLWNLVMGFMQHIMSMFIIYSWYFCLFFQVSIKVRTQNLDDVQHSDKWQYLWYL